MKQLHVACLSVLALGLSGCAEMLTWGPEPQREVVTAPTPPPAPPIIQREPEPLPDRPVGPSDYMVRKGDTVYSIAFRNQVDYREVARWNHIGSDFLIRPGQVLRMSEPPPLQPNGDLIASQPVEMNDDLRPQPVSTVRVPITQTAAAPPPAPVPVAVVAPPVASEGGIVSSTPPPGVNATVGWKWPTEGTVLRGFAPEKNSKGLDFGGQVGQPVYAAGPGKVVYSGNALKGYGELVIIKHDELHLSAYGYNQKRLVKEGDSVAAGQQIAELGMGPENRPTLHFEIRERGRPVNPVPFLPAR